MGIEFIRATSKDHTKAWQREAVLAANDLVAAANAPTFVSHVLLADVLTGIELLNPETVLLLRSEGGQLDCYLGDLRVATVKGPAAMRLASEIVDRPHRYLAAVIEERHVDIGQIHVRLVE
jgi:hypothetical protein